jgi:hypothetical protein
MRDVCRYRGDVHRRLLGAAHRGRTITYSELGSGRGWIGSYLYRIAHEEDVAGRPPLTAIVVRKDTGKPGPGLADAMSQIGYLRSGEGEDAVFLRATAEVFGFWRNRDPDEVLRHWRPQLSDVPANWPRLASSAQERRKSARIAST